MWSPACRPLVAVLLVAGCALQEELAPPLETAALAADLDRHWRGALPAEVDDRPDLVLLDGDADSGCGAVQEDEGSFYCGADATVYLQAVDLELIDDLDDPARRAARVHLLAHEYGHFLQDLLEVDEGEADRGPDSDSVRYELQADCLAGVFVATLASPPVGAFREAVRQAGDDVGDEPLQEREYEHGSGAQRVAAFDAGRTGGAVACLE